MMNAVHEVSFGVTVANAASGNGVHLRQLYRFVKGDLTFKTQTQKLNDSALTQFNRYNVVESVDRASVFDLDDFEPMDSLEGTELSVKAKIVEHAAEKAEADRITAVEKAKTDRIVAAEKAAADRIATEKAEVDRVAVEKQTEADRIAVEQKPEADRIVADGAAAVEHTHWMESSHIREEHMKKRLLQLQFQNAYLREDLRCAQRKICKLEQELKAVQNEKENVSPTMQRWVRSCGVYQLIDSTQKLPYFTHEIGDDGHAVGPIVGSPNSCQQQS